MKLSFALATLAALAPSALAAADANEVAFVTVFYNDLKGHLNDYLSYIQAHSTDDNAGLLSLYAQVNTYTDDSYTTLVNDQVYEEISTFATALPWWSTRLESEVQAAVGGGSSTVASTSEKASSTAKATTTEEASSTGASSSSKASSTKAASSSKASSTVESSSSASSSTPSAVATANAAPAVATAGNAVIIPLLATLGLFGVSSLALF